MRLKSSRCCSFKGGVKFIYLSILLEVLMKGKFGRLIVDLEGRPRSHQNNEKSIQLMFPLIIKNTVAFFEACPLKLREKELIISFYIDRIFIR